MAQYLGASAAGADHRQLPAEHPIATTRPAHPTPHRHGHDIGEALYVHRHTVIHAIPAQVKIAAVVAFVLIVVSTPPTAMWAFGAYLAALMTLLVHAQIPARVVLPRMLVEVPFLLFAALMPVTGPDPQVAVGGVWLSQPGLWAAWGILAKATIGVLAAILLAATTTTHDLLGGLRKLRVPAPLVQIASFMARYVHVVGAQASRMRIARQSRGFQASGPRSWPVLAASAGTLFIRSYERGERVHLAMLSRGYSGTLPETDVMPQRTTGRDWLTGMILPGFALVVALLVAVTS